MGRKKHAAEQIIAKPRDVQVLLGSTS